VRRHRDEARARTQRRCCREVHRPAHARSTANHEHVAVTPLVRRAPAHGQRGFHD